MGKVLVTGATGFVGRHLVSALLDRGDAVRVLVRDAGTLARLGGRKVDLEVFIGDIRDPEVVGRATRDAEVVLHAAAAVGEHWTEQDFNAVNVAGTLQVLAGARAGGCRRAVLISSLHVLGIGDLDPATEELPCRRTYDPASNAKIDMEQRALEAARTGGPEVVILRAGVTYGPDDPRNLPKLIEALRDGRFRFLGSRDYVVPILHVDDLVRAMLLAAEAPGAAGRIYHITDGTRTTIGEFIDRLADLSGCPRPQRMMPRVVVRSLMPLLALARHLHPRFPLPIGPGPLRFLGTSRYVDIRRARDELGYAPQIDYRAGLTDAVAGLSGCSIRGGTTHATSA
jgi:nucleoside-diphosphate-sugar epimerase